MEVAAALSFGRAIDAVPGLLEDLRGSGAGIIIDVPDPIVLGVLRGHWPTFLYGDDARIEPITSALHPVDAQAARALSLVLSQVPKPRDRDDLEQALLRILQVSRPLICISPDAKTHLPPVALRAVDVRLTIPPLNPDLIASVVRIVTGRRCRKADLSALLNLSIAIADLAIAIRADKSPAECLARLRHLAKADAERSGTGRDLSLSQLHGMAEAVAWARSTLEDLAAWRAGAAWSSVSSGALISGPPGTGKTLLASVMAAEGNIPLVTGSLARWQADDQAHLGTTLKAMRRTFDDARAQATTVSGRRGCILLIDEIDSFADRSTITHDHRDYAVQVVNALLELLDGAASREGVVVIGTTNDPRRCDPAIQRPGRLSKVLQVGYPDLDERVAMLRVRVGRDLEGVDLLPVARLTERATGAAIEELVADARRIASRANRPLQLDDLLAVAGKAGADASPAHLRRIAIHEAGHAVLAGLEVGTDGLVVALQSRDGAAGWVELTGAERSGGTRAEIEASIRVLLAGRAAEEVVLGEPSAGARQDLVAATTLAAHMMGSWGLASTNCLLAFGRLNPTEILEDRELRTEAAALLDDLYDEVRGAIRHHRDKVERIAERLLGERRLDGQAIAEILGSAQREWRVDATSGMDGRSEPTDASETTAGSLS
jgi:hypothetical protein